MNKIKYISVQMLWENKCAIALLSLAMAVSLRYCINTSEDGLAYTNSIFSLVVWGGYAAILLWIKNQGLWERLFPFLKTGFVLMLFFAMALVAGVQLDTLGRVDFSRWQQYGAILCLAVAWSPLCALVMWRLGNREAAVVEKRVSRKYFWGVWAFLFLVYIPTLLAAWPGFFTYDAESEVYMVFTNKYSTHHPLFHVVLLGWTIRAVRALVGSYNKGIAVYLLLQMVVVSGCFAYMLYFLKRVGVRRWICNIGTVFLAFFPTVSMFVCCTTKDVYFSAGVVLLTTLLLEAARDFEGLWRSPIKRVLLVFASLLVLLFRNNGIYAYLLFALFSLWVYRAQWKRLFLVYGSAVLLCVSVNGCLSQVFDAKEGSVAEMLCVPMQQLARTHAEEEESFDEQEKEILYSLIPKVILAKYHPKLADNVKVNFMTDNFMRNPMPYVELWLRKGLEHPDIYVNSFLMNTYGYWYPDTVLTGYEGRRIADREYGDSSYFAFVTERPGYRGSKLPLLERFYEKVSLEIYQQKLPGVSMLFSIGCWFWVYLFAGVYLWKLKYRRQAFSLLLMGFIFLTVILGPIALVRYVLYFFFGVPLVLALLFDSKAVAGRTKNIR